MFAATRLAGFTFLEFLMSLSLSVLVMSGLIVFYTQTVQNLLQLTTAQRDAIDAESLLAILRNAIANAGSNGCDREVQPVAPIQGNAQTLQVSYQAQPQLRLLRVTDEGRRLLIEHGKEYGHNQQLYLCDIDHAELVTVNAVYSTAEGEVIKLTTPLKYHYRADAVIGAWVSQLFYLDKKSLILENAAHDKAHLFEGVTRFNVAFDVLNQKIVGAAVKIALGMREPKPTWLMYSQVNSELT